VLENKEKEGDWKKKFTILGFNKKGQMDREGTA